MLATLMALAVLACCPQPAVPGGDRLATVWIVDRQTIVPGSATVTMRAEAKRIWSRYDIELRWSSGFPNEPTPPLLVVLLTGTTNSKDPLGSVARVGGTFRRQIVISDPAMTNLLAASGVRPTDSAWKTLYAWMFARVFSHELGHLLLNSAGHSATGLMRPRFARDDVKSSAVDRFFLTGAEAATIRATVAAQATLAMK